MSVSRISEWKIIWRNLMASPSEAHLRAMELERHVNALKAELADLRKGDWVNRVFDAEAEVQYLREQLLSEQQTSRNWVKVAELMMPYVMSSSEFSGKFAPHVMTHFTNRAVRSG